MYKYAFFDVATKKVYSFIETHAPMSGAGIVAAPDASVVGKTWNGSAFV